MERYNYRAVHAQHRTFSDILVAVKAFRAGEELTWDQMGLITQALTSRMKSLESLTGTRRRHAYCMLAERIRNHTPLNCVEEMALEELEECLQLAQDEESGREMREMGQAVPCSETGARGPVSAEQAIEWGMGLAP